MLSRRKGLLYMNSKKLRKEGAQGEALMNMSARGKSEVLGSLTSSLSLVNWVFIKELAFSTFPEY